MCFCIYIYMPSLRSSLLCDFASPHTVARSWAYCKGQQLDGVIPTGHVGSPLDWECGNEWELKWPFASGTEWERFLRVGGTKFHREIPLLYFVDTRIPARCRKPREVSVTKINSIRADISTRTNELTDRQIQGRSSPRQHNISRGLQRALCMYSHNYITPCVCRLH